MRASPARHVRAWTRFSRPLAGHRQWTVCTFLAKNRTGPPGDDAARLRLSPEAVMRERDHETSDAGCLAVGLRHRLRAGAGNLREQGNGQKWSGPCRCREGQLHAEVREGSLSWRSRFRTLALEVSQSYGGSRHSGSLLLARQAPVRGELIDEFRKVIAQSDQQVGAAHAGLLSNGVERLASERVFQIIWSDCLVGSGTDPG